MPKNAITRSFASLFSLLILTAPVKTAAQADPGGGAGTLRYYGQQAPVFQDPASAVERGESFGHYLYKSLLEDRRFVLDMRALRLLVR